MSHMAVRIMDVYRKNSVLSKMQPSVNQCLHTVVS